MIIPCNNVPPITDQETEVQRGKVKNLSLIMARFGLVSAFTRMKKICVKGGK